MHTAPPTIRVPRARRARHLAGIALAAAVAVVLTACGTAGPSEPAATGDPVKGGTLTLGVGLQLLDFDPFNGTNQNYIVTKALYSNLIRYTPDLKPESDLATEWKIAEDHRSVTVTLRQAGFADGTPVTAGDVVAGVARAKDPKIALTQAGVASFIDSATAVDERTVRVDFTEPTNEDRILDWMFYFPVVEAAKNNPDALKTQAAGSGPFMVKSYTPGTELTLVPNPNYYDPKQPYLDEVVYRFFSDQDGMVSALQSGDLDGTVWQELRYDAQLKDSFQLIDASPSAETMLFYVNPTMAPFDDVDCRQAVIRAIDREKVLRSIQGESGQVVPGPFPPSSPAFDEALFKKVGYDADAAAKGIAASCATTTAVAPSTPSTGVAQGLTIIQADLAAVGFDLKLENMDQATFATLLRDGKAQVAMFPTVNPFRSVASLATNRGFSGGENNYWWFGKGVPADYRAALDAARDALTPDEIASGNAGFSAALIDNSWMTGLYTKIGRFALSDAVQGWSFSPANQLELGGVYLTRR
jgi:peptide/nickel transport system substrate-binding protein